MNLYRVFTLTYTQNKGQSVVSGQGIVHQASSPHTHTHTHKLDLCIVVNKENLNDFRALNRVDQ